MTKQVKIHLKGKLAELARLQDEIKALQEEAEELKEQIKQELPLGDYEFRLEGQKYLVKFETGTNISLDKARLITDFGATIIDKYTKTTAFTKLTIKHSA